MQAILLGSMAHYFFAFLLSIMAIFLIGLILLQRGRGGGLSGALGGAGGQSAFGSKTGDVFTKVTIGVAFVWIALIVAADKVLTTSSRGLFGPVGDGANASGDDSSSSKGTGGSSGTGTGGLDGGTGGLEGEMGGGSSGLEGGLGSAPLKGSGEGAGSAKPTEDSTPNAEEPAKGDAETPSAAPEKPAGEKSEAPAKEPATPAEPETSEKPN